MPGKPNAVKSCRSDYCDIGQRIDP